MVEGNAMKQEEEIEAEGRETRGKRVKEEHTAPERECWRASWRAVKEKAIGRDQHEQHEQRGWRRGQ